MPHNTLLSSRHGTVSSRGASCPVLARSCLAVLRSLGLASPSVLGVLTQLGFLRLAWLTRCAGLGSSLSCAHSDWLGSRAAPKLGSAWLAGTGRSTVRRLYT